MIPIYNTLNRLNKLNITGKLHPTPVMWHNYSDTSLAVVPISNTAFTLTWTLPASPNISKVLVEGSADGSTWAVDKTLGAVETVDVTGLTNNTLRYFRLVLVGPGGYRSYGAVKSATTFDDMSQAYFAAMATQLTAPQKVVINAAMVATSAQLAKSDCVILDCGTEQRSLLWMNDPTKSATKVNSPTYTPYKGWTGSTSSYINTNYNPSNANNNIKLDSVTLGVFTNNYVAGLGHKVLVHSISYYLDGLSLGYMDLNSLSGGINDNGNNIINFNVNVKEFAINRRYSNTNTLRNINKEKKTRSVVSSILINDTLLFSRTSNRCPLIFCGSYLTDQELSDFQDAWLPVLEFLGSDYWSNFTPATLTATAGAGKIDLAWTLPVTTYSPYTVTNVVIQESIDNVTFTDLTTLGAVTSHSVTVPTGQTRYYKIRYVSSRNIHTTKSAEAHATAL